MDRRRPSRATLIAAGSVVVAVLAALVVLPLLLSVRIDRERTEIQTIAQPARDDLNTVNDQLGHEIANLSRYALTHDAQFIAEYRRALTLQQRAMEALRRHVDVLGNGAVQRFSDLAAKSDTWHAAVESWLLSPQAGANQMAYEGDYPAVVEAVSLLDDSISGYQTEQRNAMANAIHLHTRVAIVLVLLALGAAVTVVWLVLRLRNLTETLANESDERLAALRSRDEILGIVSHDLRSPLTTITLSTQLIDGGSEEERKGPSGRLGRRDERADAWRFRSGLTLRHRTGHRRRTDTADPFAFCSAALLTPTRSSPAACSTRRRRRG